MNLKMHGKTFSIDKESGELICNCGCGRVLTERITDLDHLEPANGNNPGNGEAKQKQTSAMILGLHDKGHATFISMTGRDYAGKELPKGANIAALRTQQRRARMVSEEDRRLAYQLKTLNSISAILQTPKKIQDECAYLLHKLSKKGGLRPNMATQALVLALHYLAYKETRITMNYKDAVAKLQGVNVRFKPSLVRKYVEVINETLKIETNLDGPLHETRLIVNCCSEYDLGAKTRTIALSFLNKWCQLSESTGKSTGVRAGVCIFFALDHTFGRFAHKEKMIRRWDRDIISEYLGVSRVAISKTVSDMQNWIRENEKEILN